MAEKVWLGNDAGNEGDLNVAANWDPSGVPGVSDNVHFRDSSQNVTASFTSIATIANLNIDQTFTGTFSDYWQVTVTNDVHIGAAGGFTEANGSAAILLDLKTGAVTVHVHNTGSSATAGSAAFKVKGANASNVLNVKKGSVEVEPDQTESGTWGTINVSFVNNRENDAQVVVGDNVTLTTWKQTGGNNILRTAATTVTVNGGQLTTEGSGAITTINSNGGTIVSNSSGTITTANIKGKVDFMQSLEARTVTTLKLNPGGILAYDPDVITITHEVQADDPVVYTAAAP